MSLIDVTALSEIEKQARKEIAEERTKKAKDALIKKLRELDNAEQIVANVRRQIEDLKASIADGSFAG